MSEGPRGEVVCPACYRRWETCACEDVLEGFVVPQEEATCPECSEPWEFCGCEEFAVLEEAYDDDPGPPSARPPRWRPGSHSLPAPELDV